MIELGPIQSIYSKQAMYCNTKKKFPFFLSNYIINYELKKKETNKFLNFFEAMHVKNRNMRKMRVYCLEIKVF